MLYKIQITLFQGNTAANTGQTGYYGQTAVGRQPTNTRPQQGRGMQQGAANKRPRWCVFCLNRDYNIRKYKSIKI